MKRYTSCPLKIPKGYAWRQVVPRGDIAKAPVGYELLGRIIDGRGIPIDDKGPLHVFDLLSINNHCPLIL